jgi:hypothetical protein
VQVRVRAGDPEDGARDREHDHAGQKQAAHARKTRIRAGWGLAGRCVGYR